MLKDKNVVIETADFGITGLTAVTKIEAAVNSAVAFHDAEYFRLTTEREKLRERLLVNPAEFDAIEEKLRRNHIEIDTLERSWKTSSINKKYVMSRTQRAEAGLPIERIAGCEKRISAMPITSNTFLENDESRPSEIAGQKILAGYAAKYNRLSLDLGGFREKILPGAFNKVIKNCDCFCLFNHDNNHILGRTKSRTLVLFTDTIGLGFFADMIPNDALSDSIAARVQRGDISGCSFQFIVGRDSWEFARKPDEVDVRTILEISELRDVGPVIWPAYPSTIVGLREKPKTVNNDAGGLSFQDLQDEEDDEIFEGIRRSNRAREALVELDYKRAGRIINLCKARLS